MEKPKRKRKKSDFCCKYFGFAFFICVQTIYLFDTGHFLAIVHAIPTVVLQIGKTDKQKKQINSLQCDECNL